MHGNYFCATVQMGVLRLKVMVLISRTSWWHMLTPSESTLLSRPFIDSLTGFWISVMNYIIQMSSFRTEYASVHHHIICTGFKYITPMFLSINITVHFLLQCMNGIQLTKPAGENGIDSLIQWLKLLSIRKSLLIMISTSRSSLV